MEFNVQLCPPFKNQSLANPHNYRDDRVAHALPPMCLPPPQLYTMTGMGDSVFWLPHPPVKFTQLSTLCAVMAASERLKV